MTTTKVYQILVLGFAMIGVAWQGGEAKKQKNSQATDTERLISAAQSCDLPTLRALIASGVSVSAVDANGYDALSRASLNRKKLRGYNKHNWWTLECPLVVAALTEAGADPSKAKFYQNPQLDTQRPEMIAIIRVEDNRAVKGESEKIMEEMTDGIETQLHNGHFVHLGYPILGLNAARQKLRTSGFSAEDTMTPDPVKACKALAVDTVFEASLEDFRSASIGIVTSAGIRMKFTFTDCKTLGLLWRNDQDYTLSEGWLIRAAGGNKINQIITGYTGEPAVGFPRYEK